MHATDHAHASHRLSRQVAAKACGQTIRFRIDNDTQLIAPLIAYFNQTLERLNFKDPAERSRIAMALSEAMENAIIHGNLEVSSDLRASSMSDYCQLANVRRTLPPYADRRVHVTVHEMSDRITFAIEDEGPGFVPDRVPDPTAPENICKLSGRGLLLIRSAMDSVEYNARGNRITMTKWLHN